MCNAFLSMLYTICLAPTEQSSQFVGQSRTLWWYVKHNFLFVFPFNLLHINISHAQYTYKHTQTHTLKSLKLPYYEINRKWSVGWKALSSSPGWIVHSIMFVMHISFHFDLINVWVFTTSYELIYTHAERWRHKKHQHQFNLLILFDFIGCKHRWWFFFKWFYFCIICN